MTEKEYILLRALSDIESAEQHLRNIVPESIDWMEDTDHKGVIQVISDWRRECYGYIETKENADNKPDISFIHGSEEWIDENELVFLLREGFQEYFKTKKGNIVGYNAMGSRWFRLDPEDEMSEYLQKHLNPDPNKKL